MFRSLVIAVTLTGMTLCQYRCMGTAAASELSEVVADGCSCCHPPQGSPCQSESPEPCCPGHNGDCHCHGVCGGALTGEAPILDGLLQAWAAAAVPVAALQDVVPLCSRESRYAQGDPAAPGAPDGRALRILIASLLT